jgi:hypothetical protein
MAGNFSIRRDLYLELGGVDEKFFGACYRLEAELSYRIFQQTRRKVRFLPQGSLRHLHAGGGTRTFGHKDTWAGIGGVVGDYYFAHSCFPFFKALRYALKRVVRAPLNRNTLSRPWLVPSLFLREIVAWGWALSLLPRRKKYIKPLSAYRAVLGVA